MKKQTNEQETKMKDQVTTKNIVEALSLFQSEAHAASKSKKNPFFKSTYASLDEVIAAVNEGAKYGLAFTQCIDFEKDIVDGKLIPTMYVKTSVMHKASDTVINSRYLVVPKNHKFDDSQALGSAITYAKRYALQAIYGLPSEDDDGNANTHNAPNEQQEQIKKINNWIKSFQESVKQIVQNKDLDEQQKIEDLAQLQHESKTGLDRLKKIDQGAFNKLTDFVKDEVNKLSEKNNDNNVN